MPPVQPKAKPSVAKPAKPEPKDDRSRRFTWDDDDVIVTPPPAKKGDEKPKESKAVKEIEGDSVDPETRSMIAFFLPDDVAVDLSAQVAADLGDHVTPPASYHVTLVYLGKADMIPAAAWVALKESMASLAKTIAPFKATINGIGQFVQDDEKCVFANVDAPALPAIRTWLMKAIKSSGIDLQLEHGFSPHVTLAYVPESFYLGMIDLRPLEMVIDTLTIAIGPDHYDYDLEGKMTLKELSADLYSDPDHEDRWSGALPNEGFYRKAFKEYVVSVYESSFVANPPEVPLANGVDVDALAKNDEGAVFITLPIAKVNWTSRNGLYYDQELVNSIRDQVNSKRVGGIQGHIPDEERTTSFPLPVCIWIGAIQQGDVLWGKAYVLPGAFRDYVKALKAAKGGISTSIYGPGDFIRGPDDRVHCDNLVLESIDFAPPDRASLQLGGGFALTAEMQQQRSETVTKRIVRETSDTDVKPAAQPPAVYEDDEEGETENPEGVVAEQDEGATKWDLNMPLKEFIGNPGILREFMKHNLKELGNEEAYKMMSKEMAKYCAEQYAKEAEIPATGPAVDAPQPTTTVAEMTNKKVEYLTRIVAEYQKKDFNQAVEEAVKRYTDWHVTSEQGKQKLQVLRHQLRDQILAKTGQTVDTKIVSEMAKSVWDGGFSVIAEMAYASLAGPSAFIGGRVGDSPEIASDEEANASRAKLGW